MATDFHPSSSSTVAQFFYSHFLHIYTGPAFQGHITITESVAVPGILLPPTPPTKQQEIPAGLKQRFVPFGCGEFSMCNIAVIYYI